MEGLDAWPRMACILAAGAVRRHLRRRTRRRLSKLPLGAPVPGRTGCGTSRLAS